MKKIKQLILASYTDGKLDPVKVNIIADHLSRSELKQYIKGLKYMEKKSTVFFEVPFLIDDDYKNKIKNIFKNKKIVFKVNPDLILGARIVDNDNVYELNLKDRLNDLEEYIEEVYD